MSMEGNVRTNERSSVGSRNAKKIELSIILYQARMLLLIVFAEIE